MAMTHGQANGTEWKFGSAGRVGGGGTGGGNGSPADGNANREIHGPKGVNELFARLKGVVLLGGAVRSTALSEGIGRSMLDLPLERDKRLLDVWVEQCGALAAAQGIGRLKLMVMLDATSAEPQVRGAAAGGSVVVEVMRDPFELRGTGGVLHDVSRELGDEDYLVVATGAQILVEPLRLLVEALASGNDEGQEGGEGCPDVGILGHRDGTPSGLMLIRCGVLREISDLGFVDLKEQALPQIAKKHRVIVEHRETASDAVRTTADYLGALRHYHRRLAGQKIEANPFAEDWKSEFSLVEEGATVAGTARLFDSVVLSGGVVGEGAVLVRSIVCGGARVKARQRAVEELISADGRGMAKTMVGVGA